MKCDRVEVLSGPTVVLLSFPSQPLNTVGAFIFAV